MKDTKSQSTRTQGVINGYKANVRIKNSSGLHARPAAIFVKTCVQFKSDIKITKGGKQANAKNILQVLALGIDLGDEIVLEINGDDEDRAYQALIEASRKRIA
ncbi:MAG: HPr family phosphocarrier protein [Desulfurococcaceae archaeon]